MIINSNNITSISQRAVSQSKIDNKFINNSLPYINMNIRGSNVKKRTEIEKSTPLNLLIKEDGMTPAASSDLENIDISMNFLKDLSTNNSTFIYFLQLMQTHMDIELLLDSVENGNNNLYRRKTVNTISNDKINKLNNLLNNYFNTLSMIYLKNSGNGNIPDSLGKTIPIDNFFLYPSINNILHKCIKIQICLNAAIMITLSQLAIYEINSLIKNHFYKIIKEISNPLFNIFETFIKEEINLNYPELITINLKPDFN